MTRLSKLFWCSYWCVILVCPTSSLPATQQYDLTLVGFHRFDWGIGRRPISLIDTLKDSLQINYIPTRPKPCNDTDIDESILQVLYNPNKAYTCS